MENTGRSFGESLIIALQFLLAALIFSASAATLIVTASSGWRIIVHGVQMCPILWRENQMSQVLYSSCGCACVLILLLPLSLVGLKYSLPRLIHVFRLVGEDGKRRWKKPEQPHQQKPKD